MKNEYGYWVSSLTAERHIDNIIKALIEGKKDIALFDLRELSLLKFTPVLLTSESWGASTSSAEVSARKDSYDKEAEKWFSLADEIRAYGLEFEEFRQNGISLWLQKAAEE